MEQKRDRGYYRTMARRKAMRKRNICRHAYGFEWYNDFHRYSKGKIHCSCPMCRFGMFDVGRNTADMRHRSMSTRRRFNSYNQKLADWQYENI